ncbi:PREDICTED: uncharacterized protein LOC109488299 [Branchiostoma belcheri]|uniref:Uncharacterized protein LOC109488299 n=1 Tax=Branchiostoma belcheri TaxID=7741 RepID=A0A6P5A484_BRABE|nr:PREDICTED: uncharacterized protein LOC109488299 [Branchiostoma belcheri]
MVHPERGETTDTRRGASRRVEMVFGSIVLLVYVPLFIRVLSASASTDDGRMLLPWAEKNATLVLNVTRIGAYEATLTWAAPRTRLNLTDVTYRLSVDYRHYRHEAWKHIRDLSFTDKTSSHLLKDLESHSWYQVCLWIHFENYGNFGNLTGDTSDRKVCREFVTKHVLTRDGILAIFVATLLGCMILAMIGTCVVDVYFYTIKGHDREKDIVMVRASMIPYVQKNRCPCQDRNKLQRKQSKKQKKPAPSGMYGLRGGTIKR